MSIVLLEVMMTPHRRFIAALRCTPVLIVVLGAGSADAQRAAQRAPAPAMPSRNTVPRPPISPRLPPYSGGSYYRSPLYRSSYYGRPPYWYGVYGGPYYDPFSFSVGSEPGYPYYRSPDYPYYPYYQPYPSYPFYRPSPSYPSSTYYPDDRDLYSPITSLQLSVTPWNAEVFIDGFYAGTVDDFDGSDERLRVEPGNHTVEVFSPGHRTLTRKIYLQPGLTFTLGAVLEALAPGETEPVRPGASRP